MSIISTDYNGLLTEVLTKEVMTGGVITKSQTLDANYIVEGIAALKLACADSAGGSYARVWKAAGFASFRRNAILGATPRLFIGGSAITYRWLYRAWLRVQPAVGHGSPADMDAATLFNAGDCYIAEINVLNEVRFYRRIGGVETLIHGPVTFPNRWTNSPEHAYFDCFTDSDGNVALRGFGSAITVPTLENYDDLTPLAGLGYLDTSPSRILGAGVFAYGGKKPSGSNANYEFGIDVPQARGLAST